MARDEAAAILESPDQVTFAKVGGPPWNWKKLIAFDGDARLESVIEVDTVAGYALLNYRDLRGRWVRDESGERLAVRRIESQHLRIVAKAAAA